MKEAGVSKKARSYALCALFDVPSSLPSALSLLPT
jgi:hypothetical protein